MTTSSERSQVSAPEYEPKTEKERMKNKSNNIRLRNLVEIRTKDIEYRFKHFEKKDIQETYSIASFISSDVHNLRIKKPFPDPFNFHSSILEVKMVYETYLKYYFNRYGQAMKIEVDTKKGDSPSSHLTPEDYIRVDNVLVNIESGEYKIPF